MWLVSKGMQFKSKDNVDKELCLDNTWTTLQQNQSSSWEKDKEA